MLLYRVFPYLASAKSGDAGSAEYLHLPQGHGRLDNPKYYSVWYLSAEASAAVGEVFGDITTWSDTMFDFPALPGSRRALGVYQIPDTTPILDLDDPKSLFDRGIRPTQVVVRNRPATQAWALEIFREQNQDGTARWAGVKWWSFQRPQWVIYGLWGVTPTPVRVESLDLDHIAVEDARQALGKPRA